MGREMRRLGLGFDLILASPAARVTETLTELAQGYGGAVDTRVRRAHLSRLGRDPARRSSAPPTTRHERLLLVGHNPGIEQLALLLAAGGALRDRIAAKYPTGALAELALRRRRAGATWRPARAGSTRFIRPRDLDPELGPGRLRPQLTAVGGVRRRLEFVRAARPSPPARRRSSAALDHPDTGTGPRRSRARRAGRREPVSAMNKGRPRLITSSSWAAGRMLRAAAHDRRDVPAGIVGVKRPATAVCCEHVKIGRLDRRHAGRRVRAPSCRSAARAAAAASWRPARAAARASAAQGRRATER